MSLTALGIGIGIMFAAAIGYRDLWSAKFVRAAGQWISMSNADWGTYDRSLFTVSMFFTRDSIGSLQVMAAKWGATVPVAEWYIRFLHTDNRLYFAQYDGSNTGVCRGPAITDSDVHHTLIIFDYANPTVTERMKIFIDGVDLGTVTAAPTGVCVTGVEDMTIGAHISANHYDGLINEFAFVSGRRAAVSEFRDPVTGLSKDLTGMPDLHAWARFENSWEDKIKATDWTPVNAPIFVRNP